MSVVFAKTLAYLLSFLFSSIAFIEMANWKKTRLPEFIKKAAKKLAFIPHWNRTRQGIAFTIAVSVIFGAYIRFEYYREPPYFIDLYADSYEARVILNDPLDMYTKSLPITEKESTCEGQRLGTPEFPDKPWTKEDCAPYPPLALAGIALAFAAGGESFSGFYNIQVQLEIVFALFVLLYALQTRRYLIFPLYFLSPFTVFMFWKESHMSFLVSDFFFLIGLILLESKREGSAFIAMGLSAATKFLNAPMALLTNRLSLRNRWLYFVIPLFIFLILPVLIFDNYLYIFQRGSDRPVLAPLLTLLCLGELIFFEFFTSPKKYLNDVMGFSMLPSAIYFTLSKDFIAPNYYLLVLSLPDRRYYRNILSFLLACVFAVENDIMGTLSALLVIPLFIVMFVDKKELRFKGITIPLIQKKISA
ncbi:MAG: hypothetical protein QW728_07570 [Thermoplasmata archaeon]